MRQMESDLWLHEIGSPEKYGINTPKINSENLTYTVFMYLSTII